MKKPNYLVIGIIALILTMVTYSCSSYNGLVDLDTEVEKTWNNVETQYQRRGDLIENLAKTTMKSAEVEKSILSDVISARTAAKEIKLTPDQLTPENLQKFQQAQDNLNSAYSRSINVLFERYPDLKSMENFAKLNDEIAGTENRISTARTDFNEAIMRYNKKVRRFPSNIFANIFGFDKKDGFKADEGNEKAPDMSEILK
jgi:LemA protein